MKGVCPDYAQETGAVGVFCTHNGLRWDGVTHGLLTADERYVSFRSRHHHFFIPDRCSFCLAMEMLDIPLPVFHLCAMNAPLWAEWVYVAGVGICGVSPFLRWSFHIQLTYLMIRLCNLRLHYCVHKRAQGRPWARTQTIASYEDLDPRLDGLFLYNGDIQRCHADVCGYGEGESEELPSGVSFRVCDKAMEDRR